MRALDHLRLIPAAYRDAWGRIHTALPIWRDVSSRVTLLIQSPRRWWNS